MSKIIFYHNPRCSKSRQALEILENANAEIEVVRYLEAPPSVDQLKKIKSALGVDVREFMRSNEQIYKDLKLDNPKLSNTALLQAIAEHPKLLERPIALKANKAVIGRPPEKILDILD